MLTVASKVCRTCGLLTPHEDFWGHRNGRDGLQTECKTCMQARNCEWKRRNAHTHRDRTNATVDRSRARHAIRALVRGAKHRAKLRGLEFDLHESDLIVPAVCPILKTPIASAMGKGLPAAVRRNSPSLERVDNSRGYTRDNVIIVSYRANRLKSDASLEELEALARFYRRLADERRRKGEGRRVVAEVQGLPAAVPAVLAAENEAKPKTTVPARHSSAARDQGVLPSLQLGDDIQS